MKRWIGLVLILALLAATCLPAVLAEDANEVSADVDAEVALADDAGDTGLTIEGAPEEEPQAEEPGIVEATEETALQEGEALVIDTDGGIADDDTAVAALDEEAVAAAATSIALSESSIKIGVDESCTLEVIALPKGSTVPPVTWRSSNKKYVQVDSAGKITGVKKGSATVYAKAPTGQEVACKVTVKNAPDKITVESEKLTLAAGGMTTQLNITLPKGTASRKLTFKSNNTKVATVDENGVIKTVGSGKATITVKTYNRKTCKVKVTVTAAPASIDFPIPELSIAVDQTYKLAPKVQLADGKSAKAGTVNISYAIGANSRDAGCITLDAATGKVTGVRKGSAIITATTANGKTALLNVKVAAAPAEFSLSEHTVTIGKKDVYSGLLPLLTAPSGEKECASTVAWKSSDKDVATVDANGVITAVGTGSCKITATTANGLKDTCKVKVYRRPSEVSLKPASASLKVGGTGQFKIVFPKNTCSVVTFSSSNEKVATVDDNGVVTAVSVGVVTITVTTYNNKTAKAKLTVTKSDVSLPDDDIDPPEGEDVFRENMTNAEKVAFIIRKAKSQMGKPYKPKGGYTTDDDPSGFDCSGLVYWCFRQAKIRLKATAYKQGADNDYQKITDISQLKAGDVVCFHTNASSSKVNHTGIYIGKGDFIHASSSGKKVIKSSLSSGYYKRVFSWGRRILVY